MLSISSSASTRWTISGKRSRMPARWRPTSWYSTILPGSEWVFCGAEEDKVRRSAEAMERFGVRRRETFRTEQRFRDHAGLLAKVTVQGATAIQESAPLRSRLCKPSRARQLAVHLPNPQRPLGRRVEFSRCGKCVILLEPPHHRGELLPGDAVDDGRVIPEPVESLLCVANVTAGAPGRRLRSGVFEEAKHVAIRWVGIVDGQTSLVIARVDCRMGGEQLAG